MKLYQLFIAAIVAFACGAQVQASEAKAPKINVVNFKTCVEKSKVG